MYVIALCSVLVTRSANIPPLQFKLVQHLHFLCVCDTTYPQHTESMNRLLIHENFLFIMHGNLEKK